MILRLDIEASLQLLAEIFPAAPDPSADCDYGEPAWRHARPPPMRGEHRGDFRTDAAMVRNGAGNRHRDYP